MKMKFLLLVITGGLFAASCCKTYQCKDNQTAIITGEVCASSQAEAQNMCDQNSTNSQTAIKK